jgi:GNAT superfamily N-acetyltransferase
MSTMTWRWTGAVVRQPTLITLTDARVLLMRAATDDDLHETMAMHARCGRRTLQARYLTGIRPPSRRHTRALLSTDIALVAESPTGSVVGLGNIATAEENPGTAEIAVLVEDDWQGRGIGTALLHHLVGGARLAGYDEVVAICPTIGGWIQDGLARLGDPLLQRTPFGEAVVRLVLAPHHVGLLGPPADARARTVVTRPGVASGQ